MSCVLEWRFITIKKSTAIIKMDCMKSTKKKVQQKKHIKVLFGCFLCPDKNTLSKAQMYTFMKICVFACRFSLVCDPLSSV